MARIITDLSAHLPRPLAGIAAAYIRPYENALASQFRADEWFGFDDVDDDDWPTDAEGRLADEVGITSSVYLHVRPLDSGELSDYGYIVTLNELESDISGSWGQENLVAVLRDSLDGRLACPSPISALDLAL